ncbi:hypothetical protein B0T10DRAFT_494291 [Thelonectria olida]|uniref:Uncharacterized protein n=1 Tax=Thelonectria olida TaxID=1576542 RepID=A0A9P8VWU1_9HYPO|nr:hypothetical protein B0T10DRAFT_494291 [Thelonectria olida]
MTRLLLASPHQQDAYSRPFGPLQEQTSMRFLCYCLNVLTLGEASLFNTHGFRFTSAQRASLEQLREHLQDDGWSDEALEEELLPMVGRSSSEIRVKVAMARNL